MKICELEKLGHLPVLSSGTNTNKGIWLCKGQGHKFSYHGEHTSKLCKVRPKPGQQNFPYGRAISSPVTPAVFSSTQHGRSGDFFNVMFKAPFPLSPFPLPPPTPFYLPGHSWKPITSPDKDNSPFQKSM